MFRLLVNLLLLMPILLFTNCASTYSRIDPARLSYYGDQPKDANVNAKYNHNVMFEAGNKRYAKRESLKGLRVIAVKITNTGDSTIHVGSDVDFLMDNAPLQLISPEQAKKTLRQPVPGYIAYLLLSFLNISKSDGYSTQVYPIGLIVGPGLTIGNIAVAVSANSALGENLSMYDIRRMSVKAGESVCGFITIRSHDPGVISVRMKK